MPLCQLSQRRELLAVMRGTLAEESAVKGAGHGRFWPRIFFFVWNLSPIPSPAREGESGVGRPRVGRRGLWDEAVAHVHTFAVGTGQFVVHNGGDQGQRRVQHVVDNMDTLAPDAVGGTPIFPSKRSSSATDRTNRT